MSYALFRLNSDYERLPFPFAPVNAQGATALAETTQGAETWRWRVFSAGAMIFIVIEEVVPESQRGGNTDIASLGLIAGFIIMMCLDVALG